MKQVKKKTASFDHHHGSNKESLTLCVLTGTTGGIHQTLLTTQTGCKAFVLA